MVPIILGIVPDISSNLLGFLSFTLKKYLSKICKTNNGERTQLFNLRYTTIDSKKRSCLYRPLEERGKGLHGFVLLDFGRKILLYLQANLSIIYEQDSEDIKTSHAFDIHLELKKH